MVVTMLLRRVSKKKRGCLEIPGMKPVAGQQSPVGYHWPLNTQRGTNVALDGFPENESQHSRVALIQEEAR